MAVYRGGVAFWVRCGRSRCCRHPIRQQCWSLTQTLDLRSSGPSRPISCFSRAASAPPSHLRYQTVGQSASELSLSHTTRHTGHRVRTVGLTEDDWEENVSLCVLSGPGESEGQRTLVEVRLLGHARLGELLASGASRPGEFLFPLTTVDGRREDDISFHCFQCPAKELSPGCGAQSSLRTGLDAQAPTLSVWPPVSYCSRAETQGGEGRERERERENEEKLALMYERLRIELPSFFVKNHDYTMYSNDIEFINGLLNTQTRGRLLYQLTLSLWKLLCAFYFADVRLEVLKLTKHSEDGTVRARWRLRGLPFPLLLLRFYRKNKTHLYRTYDAMSTFHLGPNGLIHRHRVEKVMQATPPVLPRVTSLLAGALVAMGIQDHRPALNLLPFLLSSFRHLHFHTEPRTLEAAGKRCPRRRWKTDIESQPIRRSGYQKEANHNKADGLRSQRESNGVLEGPPSSRFTVYLVSGDTHRSGQLANQSKREKERGRSYFSGTMTHASVCL
ncbi:hypothetical protein AAFF_G00313710 [Aldrovandia affinis]|uniref:Uncharacterized protein n=1 Tax=Aldrovandia affinis TaxID=143900 RepID=A0AAD7W0H2_9TELE|nr:hypothetical protein AAFF_G00313710 [Aldrovandia affinis]